MSESTILYYNFNLKIELKFLNCCPEHLSEKNCGFESANCSIIKWTVTINSWLFIDKSKGCRTSSSTRTSTPSFRTICRTVEFKTYWTWKIQVIRIWLTIIEKYQFRNEVAKNSCDSNAFVGGLQTELAQLQIRFDQVSLDLTSTRSERDSTVSEMRQEIERLNLLHGDQRLVCYLFNFHREDSLNSHWRSQYGTELNHLVTQKTVW